MCVTEQRAEEQTEANDRCSGHRDLGGQPELHRSERLGVQMDWGKTKTAVHLRCLVGKIPPVCSAFSATNT